MDAGLEPTQTRWESDGYNLIGLINASVLNLLLTQRDKSLFLSSCHVFPGLLEPLACVRPLAALREPALTSVSALYSVGCFTMKYGVGVQS